MRSNHLPLPPLPLPTPLLVRAKVFDKKTHQVTFGIDKTILELKKHLHKELNCPIPTQKLMYKGALADTDVLKDKGWKKNCKVLLIGATAAQVIKMTQDQSLAKPVSGSGGAASGASAAREDWNEVTMHKKVVDKGKPVDVAMGYENNGEIEPLQDGICKTLASCTLD